MVVVVPAHLGSPGQRVVKRVCVSPDITDIICDYLVIADITHTHARTHAPTPTHTQTSA